MNITPISLLAGMLLISLVSCNEPEREEAQALDMNELRAEIQAMEDAYAEAQNAKDPDGVVVYYADDAVSMPNNQPTVSGKAAILDQVRADMARDTAGSTTTFQVTDIKASGDLLVEAGTSTTTDAAGNVTTGKYVSVFEKRDGKYVCIRDIWNTDAPEAGSE
ncbi:YybH family protein [Neolewinella litorea]|uniref:DUF4440 domain-containing protein n=1 Tax=Neolewinella litorea TaxID=2562452 RepID=A0A4S4NDU7_9BACT|nr:nuclear transport factor 2 family protein [Neolewinella litorea]THH37696.1 DUF4440 domain-containing protein [Neolewinella litorea]